MSCPDLQGLIQHKSVVVLVGSGGVGKTTIAAAAGLQAARLGRRVLVLTIDPARRLANALGLSSFGNEVREVAVPNAAAGGSFHAVMLDTRATFDDLITRMAPDEQTRRRIMAASISCHCSASKIASCKPSKTPHSERDRRTQ